ncbi:ChiA12 [Paenibacillus mucilaginosus 3016]|uniref:ChiA12 n=1 Tax=Paenibacillus mucilaginosus 3016 TaxID=1116391 RepID=H6N9M3_9BACL|nr:fibronectin type III domain-containing protein [Paenibacillus mucilaginosus]AFC28180.1 ChiA12 [Paenibacillus mucilaginosus 3016]WFA17010.1 hypothetical protein ERY13_06545 [Paenibacillus mucilaginosus]
MKRRFLLRLCGFLIVTLLLPLQAVADESDSVVAAKSTYSGIRMAAGGESHTLALNANGTVWAWGGGQLGNGSTTGSPAPVQVQDLHSVEAIAAGGSHNLAIKSDGTVWAWGFNGYGQLGDGSTTGRNTPVQVEGLRSIVGAAAHYDHSLALKSDGTVWAWGRNEYGQLGDGSKTDRHTPVRVKGLDSVVAISSGFGYSLAVKSDGTVWAWGKNEYGQLGNGSTTQSSAPVQVQGLHSVTAVASGDYHNLAIKRDGTVWSWGPNLAGQLGDGSDMDRYTPVQVEGFSSAVDVDAGFGHSLALKSDGTVWAWGNYQFNEWGFGSSTPVQVQELDSVVDIAAGTQHSLAVRNDGTVWAWGKNDNGQLGDGTSTARLTPIKVQGFGGPEWPEGDVLTVTHVTYNSVQLNWQPAKDGAEVDQYWVYQENTLVAALNGDTTYYEVKELSPHSTYHFSLIAVNDDGSQSATKDVTVTTAANQDETLLFNRFDGTILDFDQHRILWKQTGDQVLWLFNRANQSQTKVHDATMAGAPYTIGAAKLSADGVVYSILGKAVNTRYWKDGADQRYWDGWEWGYLHEVNGNYAVFTFGAADVTTGGSRTLPSSDFENAYRFDLSYDGTVAYTDPTSESSLYLSLPDGTLTTYDPSSNYQTYSGALTDGKNMIYKVLKVDNGSDSMWSLRVRSTDQRITEETELALNPYAQDEFADPRKSYRISNGWIAYNKYNQDGDSWTLYVRSPEGEEKQASFLSGHVNIEQLGPDGTVAYSIQNQTYLYSAPKGKLIHTSTGPGTFHYIDGTWYRLDGNSLFAVQTDHSDTTAPVWTAENPLTVTDVTYMSAVLAWQPAADTEGVTLYRIYQNDTPIDTVTGSVYSYEVDGLTPSTAYKFTLEAEDAAGNKSANSPSVTVTTNAYAPVDSTAPVWPDGPVLTAADVTYNSVQLNWQPAADDMGVDSYEIYKDDSLLASVSGSVYSYTALGLFPETAYGFAVQAKDAAGNASLKSKVMSVTTSAYHPLPNPYMDLKVKPGFVQVGSTLDLVVKAEEAEDLYAFLADLKYSPQQVKLKEVWLSPSFGTEGKDAVFSRKLQDGRARLAGALLGPVPGRSGSLQLMTIRFQVLAKGPVVFTLDPNTEVADSQGQTRKLGTPVMLELVISDPDFDKDGKIGLSDLVLISRHSGTSEGQPGYDKAYDLNFDRMIDSQDVQYVAGKVAAGSA